MPSVDPVIARALTEDEYVRARRVLMRRDPKLAELMKRVGRCGLPDGRTRDPFAGLVRVIMSQQLSTKAAETIFGRVEALAGGRGGLTPASVRALCWGSCCIWPPARQESLSTHWWRR